jgi:hypothetical protein
MLLTSHSINQKLPLCSADISCGARRANPKKGSFILIVSKGKEHVIILIYSIVVKTILNEIPLL